jgi:hypothetical protein
VLEPEEIRRYYLNWVGPNQFKKWPHSWRKEYRACIGDRFISLNRNKDRLNFFKLKHLCVNLAPSHVFRTVCNFLFPSRVGCKEKASTAYPITSGEYVVDVDAYLYYRPHGHQIRHVEACPGCLENARELTLRVLDLLQENYNDIRVVFSGRAGFHCHVLDFDVRDWTYFDEFNPVKSLEVGRLKYTSYLAQYVPEAFDNAHFILSCDVMRVMSVPDSLNASTGLVCSYLGKARDFEFMNVDEVFRRARRGKASIVGLGWRRADSFDVLRVPSHFESIG